MAKLPHSLELGTHLCEAAGLNPNDVKSLELRINNREPVTLLAEVFVTDAIAKAVTAETMTFVLMEGDDDQG